MISNDQRIEALSQLGFFIREELDKDKANQSTFLDELTRKAFIRNGWFDPRETKSMLAYWATELNTENLNRWISDYEFDSKRPYRVGLILAGNIPMVGFHDVIATIISGNIAVIKCSSNDDILIPSLLNELKTN